jgi:hypothetical protein
VAAEEQLEVLQRHMAQAALAHQRDVGALRGLIAQLDPGGRALAQLARAAQQAQQQQGAAP